jgi:hypothetical protein
MYAYLLLNYPETRRKRVFMTFNIQRVGFPREGLRIRSEKGVNPEVRSACIEFGKWLRYNMEFPIRVVVYLKEDYLIKNITTKEMVSATFFAPYEKNVEPYIRIATGDYEELIKQRGREDAIFAILESIAHEVTHYQQWLEDRPIDEEEAEQKGVELVDKYVRNI